MINSRRKIQQPVSLDVTTSNLGIPKHQKKEFLEKSKLLGKGRTQSTIQHPDHSYSVSHHGRQFPALLPRQPHQCPRNIGDVQNGTYGGCTQGAQTSSPVATTVIHSKTQVPNHIIWSLFNTIFMNLCCLGFMAFICYMKSKDQKTVGDFGAQAYASTAKGLNIWVLGLGLLLTIT